VTKPAILAAGDDPSVAAAICAAAGEGAMSVCFVHRHLAAI
jgi:hypothetical protein